MKTKVLKIDDLKKDKARIELAAKAIKAGKLVAFPTETVYGLGADATNKEAVKKIFKAKKRPGDNPLIVHICNTSQLNEIAIDINSQARKLMKKFWPGPLSLVLNKHPKLPKEVSARLETVVVRFPSHKVAEMLIKLSGCPIAAPSANTSGGVSPTRASHVLEDMAGKIPIILEDDRVEFGLESTVVDCTTEVPVILRPGSLTLEELRKVIPTIMNNPQSSHRSPGMKYAHYAPIAPITLFVGPESLTAKKITETLKELKEDETLLMWHTGNFANKKFNFRLPANSYEAASQLFSSLRSANELPIKTILIQGYPRDGIGDAIMNRLEKASTKIIEV